MQNDARTGLTAEDTPAADGNFEALEDISPAGDASSQSEDTAAPATTTKPRYRMFGTLRFLLALMVAIGHGSIFATTGLSALIDPLRLGAVAVLTFFVLSGFVIAEANQNFYAGKPSRFLINRALRILPPYYVALVASVVLHFIVSRVGQVWVEGHLMPQTAFAPTNVIGNFLVIVVWWGLGKLHLDPDYTFVRYLWALVVELKFYVVAAFLFYLVTRQSEFLRRNALAIAFAVLTGLYVIAAVKLSDRFTHGEFHYYPYFALGVCIYYVTQRANRWAIAGAVISAVLVLPHFKWYVEKDPGIVPFTIGSITLLVLASVAVLALTYVVPTGRAKKVDRALGDLTYSLYLNHFAILVVFGSFLTDSRGNAHQNHQGMFLLFLLTSIGFSYLMNFLTEPFTRSLRDRIRGVSL